jgi:hypothetical protein
MPDAVEGVLRQGPTRTMTEIAATIRPGVGRVPAMRAARAPAASATATNPAGGTTSRAVTATRASIMAATGAMMRQRGPRGVLIIR